MPKKAATARSGAQRNRAKAQKSFEVVRQNAEDQEFTQDEQVEITPISSAEASSRPAKSARRAAQRASVATSEVETEYGTVPAPVAETEYKTVPAPVTETNYGTVPASAVNGDAPAPAAKGSASARLAARRGQKVQQRVAATLITAEHYTYVTRDLMIIAALASVMFIAIIVLYFTIGR